MPTYRFPALVWEDYEGYFTGSLAEYDNATAVAKTSEEVLDQLEEYAAWQYGAGEFYLEPDFLDARLIHFAVSVRPEYRTEGRIFPCEETVPLQVACVYGRQEGGLLVAALPTLAIRFYYYEQEALKDLVVRTVQDALKGCTPQELSRYLQPKSVALHEAVVRVRGNGRRVDERPSYGVLADVAESLRDVRRQFSRPWGREQEVADLVYRLGEEKANVLLVGETGIGKTSILAEAARKLERERTDAAGGRHKIWLTSGSRLIAGMKYLGQWQERCEAMIEALSEIGGVLCVDNLLDLLREGGQGPGDSVAAFLLPYMQHG